MVLLYVQNWKYFWWCHCYYYYYWVVLFFCFLLLCADIWYHHSFEKKLKSFVKAVKPISRIKTIIFLCNLALIHTHCFFFDNEQTHSKTHKYLRTQKAILSHTTDQNDKWRIILQLKNSFHLLEQKYIL